LDIIAISFNSFFLLFIEESATATYDPPLMHPLTGEKVEVYCNIPNLPPGVGVSWQKDEQPFDTPSRRVQFLNNNRKIEFSSAYPEDIGKYTCTANDEVGSSDSTNIQVFPDGK
jgi:hypothetical protein